MIRELVLFFFKQKTAYEIGVTGVQTCALPICNSVSESLAVGKDVLHLHVLEQPSVELRGRCRSEERRVGKECGSGWDTHDDENNAAVNSKMDNIQVAIQATPNSLDV